MNPVYKQCSIIRLSISCWRDRSLRAMKVWISKRGCAVAVLTGVLFSAAVCGESPKFQTSKAQTPAKARSSESATSENAATPKGSPAQTEPLNAKKDSDSSSSNQTQTRSKAGGISLLIALGLTVLISLIEIPARAKAPFKACCLNGPFFIYLSIFVIGNGVATLLSSLYIPLPPQLSNFSAFFGAFFGVFAFQMIMNNTNITFLGKGVLTIDDWISRARDSVIAAAVQRQTRSDDLSRNAVAGKLVAMDEGTLDAYIEIKLGKGEFDRIAAAAANHPNNAKFYKALAFATKDLALAINVLKDFEAKRKGSSASTGHP